MVRHRVCIDYAITNLTDYVAETYKAQRTALTCGRRGSSATHTRARMSQNSNPAAALASHQSIDA
jgi:hypothetical protein